MEPRLSKKSLERKLKEVMDSRCSWDSCIRLPLGLEASVVMPIGVIFLSLSILLEEWLVAVVAFDAMDGAHRQFDEVQNTINTMVLFHFMTHTAMQSLNYEVVLSTMVVTIALVHATMQCAMLAAPEQPCLLAPVLTTPHQQNAYHERKKRTSLCVSYKRHVYHVPPHAFYT